ncbi:TlpA disulfide reductase family protein [Bacteroides sp. 51]|uniref:TlpA family protein disulfide reductase n=1 Tax=Bacteroides sp. 51 TaxID=2302938 RepID=UPI0013D81A1C|nr:TlpA disulfide reductase family protein [Bacteroides sp. 51]NDV83316.1 TlpA family protein disulfide reductase [Bacteroides sp. 51]
MNSKLNLASLYLGALFMVLLSFSSCLSDDSDGDVENYVEVGDVIPSFIITEADGEQFDSSTLRGKKTALLFFHTGCSDCARELPIVEKAWNELKNESDVVFVAIARGQTADETDAYWKEHQLTLPKYHDREREVFELFANSYVPRLYLIDREGVVRWMGIEAFNLTSSELAGKIRMLDKDV